VLPGLRGRAEGGRVVCLWTAAVTEDGVESNAKSERSRVDTIKDALVGMSTLRKRPSLQELADTAAFLTSNRGRRITASIVNATSGISGF
jgi:hypothetical protein